MTMLLIDTNVFVGLADDRDQRHTEAIALVRRLDPDSFTTDHVIAEAWGLIARRLGYRPAERFLMGVRTNGQLRIESTLAVDLERAMSIGELWPDAGFELVDRTSFAVMERLGCRRVATFDRDFAIYRTGVDRKIAFEILR